MSFNYHKEHFGQVWDMKLESGELAHSAAASPSAWTASPSRCSPCMGSTWRSGPKTFGLRSPLMNPAGGSHRAAALVLSRSCPSQQAEVTGVASGRHHGVAPRRGRRGVPHAVSCSSSSWERMISASSTLQAVWRPCSASSPRRAIRRSRRDLSDVIATRTTRPCAGASRATRCAKGLSLRRPCHRGHPVGLAVAGLRRSGACELLPSPAG